MKVLTFGYTVVDGMAGQTRSRQVTVKLDDPVSLAQQVDAIDRMYLEIDGMLKTGLDQLSLDHGRV